MSLGYHTITWGGVVGSPSGVTSVKDLYYRVDGPMKLAIPDIAEAGYRGVEMFDGNLLDYAGREQELRDLLRVNAVRLVSVYTGANFIYPDVLPDELHRIRRAAEFAERFGAGTLAVGGGARRASGTTEADYDRLADALNMVVDIAHGHGLDASFHPHLGTIVEGPDDIARIMDRCVIGFCPDTAHLAAAGGDPAELIRRYADRVNHVHLKDLRRDPVVFLPLGKGELDFAGVLAALREIGYHRWVIVELDYYDGDPKDAAVISKSYLDSCSDWSLLR
ncbi:MAG: sugar phosphate isomerase/epimerase family protein [Sciscionella sp.]